jgi:MoCo/4Fe-4S cofactor protein with predicted Tat translocation signal
MSMIDQCPSTKGHVEIPESPAQLARMSGRPVWRSVEEFSGDPSFKEFVEREFPGGASILEETNRRSFMKVMGASLALAGAATLPGCRRPDRKILAYSQEVPEAVIPGRPLYFATALPLPGGGVEGLLVETHAGRPTKVEGNPLHPNNQGSTSAFAQASVLDLYDPDRLKYPVYENPNRGQLAATWDDFKFWAGTHFAKFDATGGAGLAFIADKQSSPTRERMRQAVLDRWPQAQWVSWSPAEGRGAIDGTRLAFGASHRVRYQFAKADRVLAVGADIVDSGANEVFHSRGLAGKRKVLNANEPMSRLYVVESRPSATGSMADHRFRLNPGQMPAFIAALARAVGIDAPAAEVVGIPAAHIKAMADDLVAHRGQAVVVPGDGLPAEAYALAMAINAQLGAIGTIVELFPMNAAEAADSLADLAALQGRMDAGGIDTVVVVEANPVYDAPGAMKFAESFAKVPFRITLSVGQSETEGGSTWSLNGCHPMEAWGDAESTDGTLSVVQPMIAPLFEPAMSAIEFLAFLAGPSHGGADSPDGYALVTQTWAARAKTDAASASFTSAWRRALHDGVWAGSGAAPATARLRLAEVLTAFRALPTTGLPGASALEVEFYICRHNDGRSANNAWLQELPEVGPSVVWDNPVYLSPSTAKALGLLPEHTSQDEFNPYTKQQMPQARMATLSIGGQRMDVAVWILPGMADHVVGVKLGYGRTRAGKVGDGAGFNTYAVKGQGLTASGAKLERARGTYTIASTQNHWSLAANSQATREESRGSIVRAIDKPWWDKHAATAPVDGQDHVYGTAMPGLSVAEQLGELSHTPANVSAYDNPMNRSPAEPNPAALELSKALDRQMPPAYSQGPQWGMTIDLASCTGCNVCTIACQSENNIPVVGKKEVAKGREMTWIRVDRYFVGDG